MPDVPTYFWREALCKTPQRTYPGKLVKDHNGRVYFVMEGADVSIDAAKIKDRLYVKENGRWREAI